MRMYCRDSASICRRASRATIFCSALNQSVASARSTAASLAASSMQRCPAAKSVAASDCSCCVAGTAGAVMDAAAGEEAAAAVCSDDAAAAAPAAAAAKGALHSWRFDGRVEQPDAQPWVVGKGRLSAQRTCPDYSAHARRASKGDGQTESLSASSRLRLLAWWLACIR